MVDEEMTVGAEKISIGNFREKYSSIQRHSITQWVNFEFGGLFCDLVRRAFPSDNAERSRISEGPAESAQKGPFFDDGR